MVKDGADQKAVVEYLKSLSPSGVELELISLASFEFAKGETSVAFVQPNALVSINISQFKLTFLFLIVGQNDEIVYRSCRAEPRL